jgi:hypothetical protein
LQGELKGILSYQSRFFFGADMEKKDAAQAAAVE